MSQELYLIQSNFEEVMEKVRQRMANGWRMTHPPALAAAGTQYYSRLYGIIVLESPEDLTPRQ